MKNQKGYILLLTLVMLVMLIILALALVSVNTSQTRIAGNATDLEISFEKSEGAVNQAINSLIKGTYSGSTFRQNNNGLYLFNSNTAPLWSTVNWNSSNAVIKSFQGNSGSAASYIIEQLPSVIIPGQNMKVPTQVYRITAQTVGSRGNTATLVQTTLQIPQ